MNTKLCRNCGQNKTSDDFYASKITKDGLQSWCKSCTGKSSKTACRAWRQRNAKKLSLIRRKQRFKRLGIDVDEKEQLALLNKQRGLCAICKRKFKLALDHCHKTKVVRGFLCKDCNLGLGRFKDNTQLLRRAASYLEDNS